MTVGPAAELAPVELLELFNASYSDYIVPMHMRESDFHEHLELNAIDLATSRVAHEDGPAAFALVGRRADEAWIGGMGTHPARRRRGLGETALRAAITAAREQGCAGVRLEVIDANVRAIALYEKLGFERVRELVVAQLDPSADASDQPLDDPAVVPVGDREAERWVAGRRSEPEPWQRAGAVLERLRGRGNRLRGLTLRRHGTTVAAAVLRDQEAITGVLQIAADDPEAASELLRAATGGDRPVRLVNVPDADPAAIALEQLGARVVARQYEMRLT